jgi:hypothetical protein
LSLARTLARDRERFRGYGDRPDDWGRGLIGAAVFVGFVGEIAFVKWSARATDFAGYGVQMKTATSRYDELLVRSSDMAAPSWNIIVRAQWPVCRAEPSGGLFDAGARRDPLDVDLCGWSWLLRFQQYSRLEPARRGSHTNYALPANRLQGMNDLAALVRARGELMEVRS